MIIIFIALDKFYEYIKCLKKIINNNIYSKNLIFMKFNFHIALDE